MPLFEFIITTRCSSPDQTANLMKLMAKKVFAEGGNVRNVQILGDRIMSKRIVGKDMDRHIVGRYIQILYDGHPELYPKLRAEAQKSYETLKVDHFRVKDFIAEAVKFTKPLEEEAHFIKNKKLEAVKYGEALKRLQENKFHI